MMNIEEDSRIVMTLDAGGTNFVFSAIRAGKEIVESLCISAQGDSLEIILKNMLDGFSVVRSRLPEKPVAISFAFPGPADYRTGIIGDLQNLPLFRGGVALGPMLKEHFQVPVFINNDGDLFAYGEAIAGLLPEINRKLAAAGNTKRYHNLLGVTFGTGFGGGIVTGGELFLGDNSAGGEINRVRNRVFKQFDAEESVSIRGIQREYAHYAGINMRSVPDPRELFEIGTGLKSGNREAAVAAYNAFGLAAGDALANAVTLVDGLIVIGGGLSGAASLFLPALVKEMNEPFQTVSGSPLDRLEISVCNLEDPADAASFFHPDQVEIPVPFTRKRVAYYPVRKTGVGISRLGTSMSVSIGAYAFALRQLDK